ncbi:MAG: DUF4893 domain-containing protein [Allosphingosinicella sp.]
MLSTLLAAALFQACATPPREAQPCLVAANEWRSFATDEDRGRLRNWRDAWAEALVQARGAGHQAEIAAAGSLLEPDAALTEPLPPVGDYDCRTIKLGSPADDGLVFVAYPPFHCRIGRDGDQLTFTKLTGSQRQIGRLFGDESRRLVFLGTMQLGDERQSYQYGVDRDRNLVAVLERVGDRRWRLVFPYPHFESLLDVIELTPRAAR